MSKGPKLMIEIPGEDSENSLVESQPQKGNFPSTKQQAQIPQPKGTRPAPQLLQDAHNLSQKTDSISKPVPQTAVVQPSQNAARHSAEAQFRQEIRNQFGVPESSPEQSGAAPVAVVGSSGQPAEDSSSAAFEHEEAAQPNTLREPQEQARSARVVPLEQRRNAEQQASAIWRAEAGVQKKK